MYRFDDCEVDVARFEVRCHGEVVHLEPQVFDLLVYLLEHRDRVVTKTELLDSVWGDRFVGESALTTRVKAARRAVGDDGATQRVIRTVHRRGYQFVADVEVGTEGAPDEVVATAPRSRIAQDIRFCVSGDGIRIAYASIGDGPPLMKAANWMTHLGHDIESTVWRHWLDGLSRHHRLVRYDERGCGMSDWDVDGSVSRHGSTTWSWWPMPPASSDSRCSDCRKAELSPSPTPCDIRIESAGSCCGAPTRVGGWRAATTDDQRREAALDIELARVGWGRDEASFRQVFTSQFLPDASREVWDEFDALQRRTTSPHNAVRFLEAFSKLDVSRPRRPRCNARR